MRVLLTLSMMLLIAAVPFAATWNEAGDAGESCATGQVPTGAGSFDLINGNMTNSDADMFCISIADPAAFTATTCDLSTLDTQLFLLDMGCYGVTANDDDPGGCGLRSTITGTFVPAAGDYWLAVSCFDYDPLDASGGELWNDTPYGEERVPDGPGAGNPMAGWGDSHSNVGPYGVAMTGAWFCDNVTATDESSFSTLKSMY